jgi:Ca-activated chloride channel family protein
MTLGDETNGRGRMRWIKGVSVVVAVLALGCGDDGAVVTGPTGSHHVTQGGAQDIARFRNIVAAGDVPDPDTLDPVGFFAEHAVDLPDATCGEDVCLHPMLAVAPRFDGSNWTMGFVGLNSPIRPETFERPPLHAIVVAERTHDLRAYRGAMDAGLLAMAEALQPEDRISVVYYGDEIDVVTHNVSPDSPLLAEAVRDAAFRYHAGAPDLYGALATATELRETAAFTGATRVLLVTSGRAETGITDRDRIVAHAEGLVREGVSFSVIGAGAEYESEIVGQIGELGAGTLAFAQDGTDLHEILVHEAGLSLYPLATDFRMEVEAAPGYEVGRIYGARRAEATGTQAELASPALFLGHREGTSAEGGRRGGGGGLFVEFIAQEGTDIGASAPAFILRASWNAADGRRVETEETVYNELAPGQNPAPRPDGMMWPVLSDPAHANVFMMLNMYLALRATTTFYDDGDCARALGLIDMVAPTVESWLAEFPSEDISADFDLLMDVQDNTRTSCTVTPIPPAFFAGSCMMS